jgi:transcriptional regulator
MKFSRVNVDLAKNVYQLHGVVRHGKTVPTWNYVVLHDHGRPQAIHDADWLFSHLNQLTGEQEAMQPSPWRVSDAPLEESQ